MLHRKPHRIILSQMDISELDNMQLMRKQQREREKAKQKRMAKSKRQSNKQQMMQQHHQHQHQRSVRVRPLFDNRDPRMRMSKKERIGMTSTVTTTATTRK